MSESELLGRGYPPSGYFTLYCGYLPPPCIPGYMDTGYSCIADTTVLRYLSKGGIHACIHGYRCIHMTPGNTRLTHVVTHIRPFSELDFHENNQQ